MPKSKSDGNLPVHTVRHRNLKAAIWRNDTPKGAIFNVTITRSYRDRESGQWHDTHSIGYDDLMNVAALMYEAHSYISAIKAEDGQKRKPTQRAAGQ